MGHTLPQVKSMIADRLEKRKELAKSTLDAAATITKNRTNRAELSLEIKDLVKEQRGLRKAEKAEAIAERKAAKQKAADAKKAAKASNKKELQPA